jgi:hypothetical protein
MPVPTGNSISTVETRRWCVVTVADVESRTRTASAPQWVRCPHLANQRTKVSGQRRPTDALWPNWRQAVQIVTPATVVRWHRRAFAAYYRWNSRLRRVESRIQSSRSIERRRGRFVVVRCSSRDRVVARIEANTAMNSAVILPENGTSLWPATATATTGTEYSAGTGYAAARAATAASRCLGRIRRETPG